MALLAIFIGADVMFYGADGKLDCKISTSKTPEGQSATFRVYFSSESFFLRIF